MQGVAGNKEADPPVRPDLGIVPNPAEEPVGNPGRAPRPAGDLLGGLGLDLDGEDGGGAPDDGRYQ